MIETITLWDYILLPLYLVLIFLIARNIKTKMSENSTYKNYFIKGLFFKIFGGLCVCFIYVFYYPGGDTTAYFISSSILPSMLLESPTTYFSILFGNLSMENFWKYGQNFKYVEFFIYDYNSFSVVRFTSIISLFGFLHFLPTTILLASISYIGVWKLYCLFAKEFKNLVNQFAFSMLFIPSVVFWGSGILKDTYTLCATCWLVYSFYMIFIYKQNVIPNIIVIIIMSYLLISIRPFMLYISLISIILMLTHFYLTNVKSAFIRIISLVLILIVFWGGGIFVLITIGEQAGGAFSTIDGMLEKAAVTQQDLSRDYYGENSFNIGAFEPTIPGILSKAPAAINAGLFYPYIWKANNPVMIIAGLENLLILLLTIYVLILIIVAIFKIGPRYMLKTLFDHPLVIFSLSYAIPFAFMVGLTTANYGALVRYKIPLIPFYLASLFIIIHKFNRSFVSDNKKDSFITK